MEWTSDKPTLSGAYGYRDSGDHKGGVVLHALDVPPGPADPIGLRAYFPLDTVGTPVAYLGGEFCGPIVLPE